MAVEREGPWLHRCSTFLGQVKYNKRRRA